MARMRTPSRTTSELTTPLRRIMQTDVGTCRSNDTLANVAQIMWDRDCGVVPITDPQSGQLVGMITDRDICMAAWSMNRPISEIRASEVSSHPVFALPADAPVARVHEELRHRQIRRVPVVDEQDQLVGIVSLNDLALMAESKSGDEAFEERVQVANTLGAICRPHAESRVTGGQ